MIDKLIDIIKQFGYPGVFACSLVLSLIGLAGTSGGVAKSRHDRAWRAWVGWWGGTASYYLLQLLFPRWGYDARWWIPQLALDAATLFLLFALLGEHSVVVRSRRNFLRVCIWLLVIGARVTDVLIVAKGWYSLVHQCLDTLVFLAWAWRSRTEIKESVTLALYGLAQLPFPVFLAAAGVKPVAIDPQLLQMTAQYAIAKPALLVALVALLRQPPTDDGSSVVTAVAADRA
jgi:hypothetical protein